jgi:GNAT superfamily N-acetyltransferase
LSLACAAIALAPAAAEDFEELLALRVAAMRESLERVGRFDPARARQRFQASFAPELTRHVLLDGRRVGFVAVRPDGAGLLLDHLYVLPAQQGRGVGSAVLALVFREADERGLALRVGALRGSDSNRFYLRHGFVLVEEAEWDLYYERGGAHG